MASRKPHIVSPIKDKEIQKQVENTLLGSFKAGRRNYTIFQVGKATLLRVSDVLSLRYDDVFDSAGFVRARAYTTDQKTGKPNTLYLRPVTQDLLIYRKWLDDTQLHSEWLFPSTRTPTKHITRKQYYKVMTQTGDLLGLNYLGTHTMRKTGAYIVYKETNHNIGLVMQLLNHSSQRATLQYLGLDQVSRESILDKIDFD
jgi:integrase